MHQLNVLISGSSNLVSTLNELKPFLKFNLHTDVAFIKEEKISLDVIIFQKDDKNNKLNEEIFTKKNLIKIFASNKIDKTNTYDGIIKLPTTIAEINSIIESLVAKRFFSSNSSIHIKRYTLNKNEKKLIKDNAFIFLTEKEIQLLELFLKHKKPVSKNKILLSVWHYSTDADTHTVETHIYRLRKKINDKFLDDKFILNNKEGYSF
ncbi:winged helix-turn-helix domain-containing protein [Pelagibacteraceae bacterium]|nr:winged helix-turn-helix domain-containing protein [Pelagibacteraceae bacterium]